MPKASFFPPLYLENIYEADDLFLFEERDIAGYYLCGKPLLNAPLMRRQLDFPVGHTYNMPLGLSADTPLCFVLLHMTRLFPEQRIRANMQKLVSFGVLAAENDFRPVLEADLAALPDNKLRGYIRELRLLLNPAALREASEAMRGRSTLRLAPDGTLDFAPEGLREIFKGTVSPRQSLPDLLGLELSSAADPAARLSALRP
jgi:hypothetical protein